MAAEPARQIEPDDPPQPIPPGRSPASAGQVKRKQSLERVHNMRVEQAHSLQRMKDGQVNQDQEDFSPTRA
jgi:hypothetical protein